VNKKAANVHGARFYEAYSQLHFHKGLAFWCEYRKASTLWKLQICKNRGFSMEIKHRPVGLELVDHPIGPPTRDHL